MSSIPSNVSRAPSLLVNQIQLANLRRSSLGLFETQSQLATGRSVLRPSDDTVATAAIAQLDDSIQRSSQRLRNIDQADANLALVESSLAEANDLLLSAKQIASTQVNIGTTQEERENQAQVVNSLIDGLLTQMNRKSVDNYLFGGSKTSTPPFEAFGSGFIYTGEFDQLTTDINLGKSVPVTLVGIDSIGDELSKVKGDVDLAPSLTPDTLLSDLRGPVGLGVSKGVIQMQLDNGPVVEIDLNSADRMEDVVTRIEAAIRDYETTNGVTILDTGGVSLAGEAITIDVVSGAPGTDPQLTFTEVGVGTTARDLGLTTSGGFAFEATQTTGQDLDPKLTMRSSIASLAGLTGALDEIVINNGGRRAQIDLSGAQTIEDLANAIQGADIGARLVINSQGTGIDIVNLVSASPDQSMTIEEVAGGNRTAEMLGIRSLKSSTRTDILNDGRGGSVKTGGTDPLTGLADPTLDVDFEVVLGDGSSFTVDLRPEDAVTIGDVIARINDEASSQGIPPTAFQASLGDADNGIVFTQDASFTGTLSIERRNNSSAMFDLGLGDATFDAASATLAGSDPAPVVSNTVFTRLIELREALTAGDTTGITFAGTKLEEVVDSVAQTRGLVGSYSKRLESARVREEDVNVMEQSFRSELRDLDFAEASTKLTLLQTQLQAGLQSMSIANQLNLLDFLG
ncbi:MAG: flagellin [Phycisphaerales bacterium JB058]